MTAPDQVTEMDEIAADDIFLDILGSADVETLGVLCEIGGPLTALLAELASFRHP